MWNLRLQGLLVRALGFATSGIGTLLKHTVSNPDIVSSKVRELHPQIWHTSIMTLKQMILGST